MAPLVLSTLVIVALQDSRKVLGFLLTNWLRIPWFFFQGVWRGWPFLSFWPIIFFSFSPRLWFEILLSLVPGRFFFFLFFLVVWMLVDIRLVNICILYIYNVIARLEFELAGYDSTLQRFNHYTTKPLKNHITF